MISPVETLIPLPPLESIQAPWSRLSLFHISPPIPISSHFSYRFLTSVGELRTSIAIASPSRTLVAANLSVKTLWVNGHLWNDRYQFVIIRLSTCENRLSRSISISKSLLFSPLVCDFYLLCCIIMYYSLWQEKMEAISLMCFSPRQLNRKQCRPSWRMHESRKACSNSKFVSLLIYNTC